jgi:peptidoglycan/xylan/chitin deacetylase (PgdA/CDA1 family)
LKETLNLIIAMVYFAYLKVSDKTPHRLVIYYHGLNAADIESFRRQMECLVHNFTVVKPSEIMAADVVASENVVAITFDDAFVSVMENAVRILKEFRLPASIFVPTGNLGQKPRWEMPVNCSTRDEIVMNKEQIAELDKDGFEIFSHTVYHPVLT